MSGYYISQKWLHEDGSFLPHPDLPETKAMTKAHANPSCSFKNTFHINELCKFTSWTDSPAECMADDTVCVLYIFSQAVIIGPG
jgi:hypothetical protein